ncbi:helix-turn-helix domain-containing protein [Paenibacillus sp. S150]|uniref:response regulator transcription factor n=1 Tax=Paenibacillus sp. S150 TaxID=2749826 RepID=UPI0028156911|nr:helix-turn-helix domain-containing protein [Paenibacillus sp. S150]
MLIVDDDICAVKRLLAGVRWRQIGVEAEFGAHHPVAARQMLREQRIDIMICAMEIPGGGALALMEWMRQDGCGTESVMLTRHAEPLYGPKAVRSGGDYLLKPVRHEELEKALLRAASRMEEKRKAHQADKLYRKYEERWNKQRPLFIERFWQNLLEQRMFPDRTTLERMLSVYDMEYGQLEHVRLILISVEGWEKPLSQRDKEIMELALHSAAGEIILNGRKGQAIRDRRGNILTIVYLGSEAEERPEVIEESCAQYAEVCNRSFHCKLSCYIGGSTQIAGIKKLYHALLHAEAGNGKQPGGVITLEEAVRHSDVYGVVRNRGNSVVHQIKAYIAERLHEELTRERLAALVFLNPAYLSRLFRKETGMALTDYILQERMRRAADQLITTDKSISQIADGLGYSNFSYFARLFRKIYAVAPHDYRKKVRRRA